MLNSLNVLFAGSPVSGEEKESKKSQKMKRRGRKVASEFPKTTKPFHLNKNVSINFKCAAAHNSQYFRNKMQKIERTQKE